MRDNNDDDDDDDDYNNVEFDEDAETFVISVPCIN